MDIKKIVDRPIAYHRAFVEFGGVVSAVMLSQAVYWSTRTQDPMRDKGWFYKTIKDWQEETGLTRFEQETAKKRLVKFGVLETEKRGMPAKLWFKVNEQKLGKLLFAVCGKPADKCAENQQTYIYNREYPRDYNKEKGKSFFEKKGGKGKTVLFLGQGKNPIMAKSKNKRMENNFGQR